MIEITLIREKPDWVKTQIAKLQDEPAVARIDKIVELDARRRSLLVEKERFCANWLGEVVLILLDGEHRPALAA